MRRSWRPLLFGLALALVIGTGTGSTLALWLAQAAASPLAAQQAVLGLSVTKDQVTDAAASSASPAEFTIGEAEAAALIADGPDANGDFAVAVPFDVTLLASAGYGLDYSFDVATAQPDTVFGLPGTTFVFFQIADLSECTVAQAASAQTYAVQQSVSGVSGGQNAPHIQVDQWCMVVTVTPPTSSTSGQAAGINLLENPEVSVPDADASWLAYIIPDPTVEPNLAVSVTPLPVLT